MLSRQDRAAAARRARRRPAARQPPDPDDRPARTSSAATSPSSTSPRGSPRAAPRVRIVTVDPVGPLPRRLAAAARGLQRPRAALFDDGRGRVRARVARARGQPRRRASSRRPGGPRTSPTRRCSELGRERFLYLIQEYEPFTFPMGSYAALAAESYALPHAALFSTELLRDYFRRHGLGVYAAGAGRGDRDSRRVRERDHGDRAADGRRAGRAAAAAAAVLRAARAARRAQHVRARRARARPGARARARSPRLDAARDRHGQDGGRRVDLGGGAALELLPRSAQAEYAGAAARARRRPRAHVHAAPEPRADRDGLRRHADGDEHVREQDGGGAGGDLAQPDHGGAERRGRSPRRWRRPRPGSATPSGASRAAACAGAATGTTSFDDALLDRVARAARA